MLFIHFAKKINPSWKSSIKYARIFQFIYYTAWFDNFLLNIIANYITTLLGVDILAPKQWVSSRVFVFAPVFLGDCLGDLLLADTKSSRCKFKRFAILIHYLWWTICDSSTSNMDPAIDWINFLSYDFLRILYVGPKYWRTYGSIRPWVNIEKKKIPDLACQLFCLA